MSKPSDLTGQRFGSLVALRPTEKRDSTRGVIWLCRCDCGMEVEVRTQSCGCRRSASSAMNIRKAFAKNPPKEVVEKPVSKAKQMNLDNHGGCGYVPDVKWKQLTLFGKR